MQDRKDLLSTTDSLIANEDDFLNEFLRVAIFVSEQDKYKDYDEFKEAVKLYESLIRDEDLFISYYNTISFSRDLVISFMDNKKHKRDVGLFIDKWNQELLVKNEKGFKIVFNIEEKINYLLSLNSHKLKMYYLYDFNDGEIKAKVRVEIHNWFKSLEFSEKLTKIFSTFFNVDSHLFTLVYQILEQEINEELIEKCIVPVFKKYKKEYRKVTLIKHRKDEFITFVKNKRESFYLDPDSIALILSDFIDYEVDKHNNLPKNKKYRQQALIDITPQQTLSIEAAAATVEEGKKDKRCLFNALQIAIAVTMVNEVTELFPKTISKTDSKGVKKFLKDIEETFKIDNVPERVVREYGSLKWSKEYFQNLDEPNKKGVKRILELGKFAKLLKDIK